MRITVGVPEMFATEVEPGDRALIHLQAIAGKEFEAKVTRTSWTLDAKNRTIRAEIDVPNPGGKLRPGLYAYATIIVEEHADAIIVPATAIVRQGSTDFLRCRAGRPGCTQSAWCWDWRTARGPRYSPAWLAARRWSRRTRLRCRQDNGSRWQRPRSQNQALTIRAT